jgi:uncharacterized protein YndB with AHSA1/START domain
MRRTRATDCRTLPCAVGAVYGALLDCESYPLWWPAHLRVRVVKATPERLGSRIEIRPRGGRFVCEIAQAVADQEIVIRYVEGVHLGTGRWSFENVPEGVRACYEIDLEPRGWFVRLLSNCLDFGKMHSRSMVQVFDALEAWLKNGGRRRTSTDCPDPTHWTRGEGDSSC